MEILDRQCEKFTGGPTVAPSRRIHVTINKKGVVFVNQKAYGMMGRPASAYLYFNRLKDMIIIEPTQAGSSNQAFPFKPQGRNSGHIVQANPFCRHFGIRPEGVLRFTNPEIDAAGRMFLKLAETVRVSRRPRKKKQ